MLSESEDSTCQPLSSIFLLPCLIDHPLLTSPNALLHQGGCGRVEPSDLDFLLVQPSSTTRH
ncbi:hypothetical protein GUITHDRAFT_152391 [Guillardia theta CCMP2712]|uniref:Uncharacterized protein n=1 Tax=Guillardia theta (strain CCMP2712) TaxID=905079 RepID=L1JD94_GUITC|nr:hypothetical protein GUITHDRAFT_152391 [Guillardia theta CCMP2712]EKX46508.1 hypothetical protein GUITHDRAFT_152391 [Guillardia theta CCMP2712]|eukprot:XP_005833488.1 hypothetical protein GUITHDRAFT_152391 [Guillardia theta CCMP2712]